MLLWQLPIQKQVIQSVSIDNTISYPIIINCTNTNCNTSFECNGVHIILCSVLHQQNSWALNRTSAVFAENSRKFPTILFDLWYSQNTFSTAEPIARFFLHLVNRMHKSFVLWNMCICLCIILWLYSLYIKSR